MPASLTLLRAVGGPPGAGLFTWGPRPPAHLKPPDCLRHNHVCKNFELKFSGDTILEGLNVRFSYWLLRMGLRPTTLPVKAYYIYSSSECSTQRAHVTYLFEIVSFGRSECESSVFRIKPLMTHMSSAKGQVDPGVCRLYHVHHHRRHHHHHYHHLRSHHVPW